MRKITEFGYFLSRGGTVLLRQSGVFRTNCVDCLDRTNVLQSELARRQLVEFLRSRQLVQDGLPDHVMAVFREIWADHADMISTQYSGTGALKTDYTRTGKRTALGALKDGVNSLTRYYKNNFCDGFRQDATDLFLGNYVVSEGEGHTAVCPLERRRDWKYITFPSVLLVATAMFCASALLPAEYGPRALLQLLLCGAAAAAALLAVLHPRCCCAGPPPPPRCSPCCSKYTSSPRCCCAGPPPPPRCSPCCSKYTSSPRCCCAGPPPPPRCSPCCSKYTSSPRCCCAGPPPPPRCSPCCKTAQPTWTGHVSTPADWPPRAPPPPRRPYDRRAARHRCLANTECSTASCGET
ncbi:unnamed protein product [Plutella xylostella]|uniref:Phosphatidylinositol-3-phosphatase SAC1 n=1 Tax=Plutella xylostella TaxID=51655 RepID=A0A8S4G7W0_PLUXY|nr:unnamed protein product [Plutella xylostella]